MNLRALNITFVLFLALPFIARSEDAPKPEAPATADVDKDKEKDKKDAEAKGDKPDAPPLGPVDPMQVTGTPPTFPLKTDNIKEIFDGYDEQDDQMNMEPRAKADIFNAIFASSQEHLVKNLNAKITYKDLMLRPEDYRGEVVNITGVLRQLDKMDCDESKYRIKNYWKGYISFGTKEIKTFIVVEPPAADIKVGSAMSITGIFMKRYAFKNAEPGEKLTVTPLVFGRRVERSTVFDHSATENTTSWMNGPIGIGIFCFIGLTLAVFLYGRAKSKARYSNHFTSVKEDRKGPRRNFPRPG